MPKEIKKHPIYNNFSKDIVDISRELLESKNKKREPSFSKRQIKIKNLYQFLIELENKFEDLKISKEFLKSHKTLGKINKITSREILVKYHLESYKINIIAIFDRVLHLVNFTYNLGLEDRHVKIDIICSNNNLSKDIKDLIKKFDKDIQDIRSSQNKIKHKEKIYIPELYNATLLDFTLKQWTEIKRKKIKIDFSWSKKDEKYLKADADFYYNIFLKKEQGKIDNINKRLNQHVWNILNIIYSVFTNNL